MNKQGILLALAVQSFAFQMEFDQGTLRLHDLESKEQLDIRLVDAAGKQSTLFAGESSTASMNLELGDLHQRKFLVIRSQSGETVYALSQDFGLKKIQSSLFEKGAATSTTVYHTVGYTDKTSYYPGDTVHFYMNAENLVGSDRAQISIYDYFTANVLKKDSVNLASRTIGTANFSQNWPESYSWIIPQNQPSSVHYWLSSKSDSSKFYYVVKGRGSVDLSLEIPTANMQAYNNYGGQSLYGFNSTNNTPETHVSLLRPLGFGWDWEGLGVSYAVQWLMKKGYSINFLADEDLDRGNVLNNSKAFLIMGHSEYWSRNMRNELQRWLNAGGNLMHLGGNSIFWHTRYETVNGPMLVCYKSWGDPAVADSDKTVNWHLQGWSAKAQLGTGPEEGGFNYQGLAALKPVAYNTNQWPMNGLGLSDGSAFPTSNRVGSYEVDGVKLAWNGSVPSVAANSSTPSNFVIDATVQTTGWDSPNANWTIGHYFTDHNGLVFSGASTNWGLAFDSARLSGSDNANIFTQITSNVLYRMVPDHMVEFSAPAGDGRTKYYYQSQYDSYQPQGWTRQSGVPFTLMRKKVDPNAVPVYGYYDNNWIWHWSTQSSSGNLAGIAGYAYTTSYPGTVPVYGWNSSGTNGNIQRLSLINSAKAGESALGIQFYVPKPGY